MAKSRVILIELPSISGLGYLKTWLKDRRAIYAHIKADNLITLPNVSNFDIMIMVGDEPNINMNSKYDRDKMNKFINSFVKTKKAMINLGSAVCSYYHFQNIAINQLNNREIGWYDLNRDSEISKFNFFPLHFNSFIWNTYGFDCPPNSQSLYSLNTSTAIFVHDNVYNFKPLIHLDKIGLEKLLDSNEYRASVGKLVQDLNLIKLNPFTLEMNQIILSNFLDRLAGYE